jgi:hypothetical protein
MATGRTVLKNYRIYIDGREMSCYSRSFGPLSCTFEEGTDDAICYDVKGTLSGNATIGMGTLNGIFDNTATSGIHALLKTPTQKRNVMIGVGIQGIPVNNDPAFVGQFNQLDYQTGPADNPVTATVQFANTSANSASLNYARPWGTLLHALGAETAANTALGLDQAAGTTRGGYMMYQITAAAGTGNMTGAVKVQHSTTTNLDGSFSDLLSSGTINCVGGGVSGVVALANNATVGRYIRFQTAFTLATSITYSLVFVRGN